MTNKTTVDTGSTPMKGTPQPTLIPAADYKGFTFSNGRIDVRGWDVVTADGHAIGKVNRVLLDTLEHQPRYLSVEIPAAGAQPVRQTLIPIGLGSIKQDVKKVSLAELAPRQLDDYPMLQEMLTKEVEETVIKTFGYNGKPFTKMSEAYALPMFDAAKFFATGQTPAKNTTV